MTRRLSIYIDQSRTVSGILSKSENRKIRKNPTGARTWALYENAPRDDHFSGADVTVRLVRTTRSYATVAVKQT